MNTHLAREQPLVQLRRRVRGDGRRVANGLRPPRRRGRVVVQREPRVGRGGAAAPERLDEPLADRARHDHIVAPVEAPRQMERRYGRNEPDLDPT